MKHHLISAIIFATGGLLLAIGLLALSEYYAPRYPSEKFIIRQLLNKAERLDAVVVGNSHTLAIDMRTLGYDGYRIAQAGNDVFEVEYQLRTLLPKLPHVKTVFYVVSYFMFHVDNAALFAHMAHFPTESSYQAFLKQFPYAEALVMPAFEKNAQGIFINLDRIPPANKQKLGTAWQAMTDYISGGTSIRERYYAAIPSLTWVRGDAGLFMLSKFAPLLRDDHWLGVWTAMLHPEQAFPQATPSSFRLDEYGQPTDPYFFQHQSREELIRDFQDGALPRQHYRIGLSLKNRPTLVEDAFQTVAETVRALQRRRIRVIFCTPPYFAAYSEAFDPNVRRVMHAKMQQLQQTLQVEYYDFSVDPQFSHDETLFCDSHHLNRAGSTAFSTKFKAQIDLAQALKR